MESVTNMSTPFAPGFLLMKLTGFNAISGNDEWSYDACYFMVQIKIIINDLSDISKSV